MSSKMVRINNDVYNWIKHRKNKEETFSDAIERLLQPPSLVELAGILSDEKAESIRKATRASREEDLRQENNILKQITKEKES